jgi:hypothetical protein
LQNGSIRGIAEKNSRGVIVLRELILVMFPWECLLFGKIRNAMANLSEFEYEKAPYYMTIV